MSKLNATAATSSSSEPVEKTEEKKLEDEESKERTNNNGSDKTEKKSDEKDIIKFTMLFNKYNCSLNMKKRNDENKCAMFFNKDVTIRPCTPVSTVATKIQEAKKSGFLNSQGYQPNRTNRPKLKIQTQNLPSQEPHLTDSGILCRTSLFSSLPDVYEKNSQTKSENLKKFLYKKHPMESDPVMQTNVCSTQKDLRNRYSLTSLPKPSKTALKSVLNSKIPSLTALDANFGQQKNGQTQCDWDLLDELTLMQSDVEKRLNLQISRSSNDNNRRSVLKFKKEESASVSDSKLLYADSDSKKNFKKCDKKSRGDSSRKERNFGGRKQVQWKTEVDVIYFSTHMAANGDRTAEVIGRVMEPLREEWEQQRKGFYAKMVSSPMESHIKDHFISLLKI